MKMWHIAALGITAALLGYLFFANTTDEVTNYPSQNTGPIIAFGDSLVEGVGATTGNDFVSVVAKQINEPIVNLGRAGDTTRDGLERLDAVLREEPRLVILLLGGNDYLRDIPPAETFTNLGTMITAIHETGAIVVLLGVRGGLFTDSYAREYRALAKEYQVAYVPDVLDGLFGNPTYMADTVHPNDAGYQRVASRVTPVVRELLR